MARKLIFNMAMSLDGYIADDDGDFSWIKGDGDKSHDTEKMFDFPKFVKTIDIIVMGRNSWEICTPETLDMFKETKILVATHRNIKDLPQNVEIIEGNLIRKINKLKKEKGKDIWLFGGTQIVDKFLKASVIDEFIIGIIPTIRGKGKKLFLKDNPITKLHLREYSCQEGIMILKYRNLKRK